MKQIILNYTLDEAKDESILENILIDIISSMGYELVNESFLNNAAKRQLRNKYGPEAFLMPDKLKYPIINPRTGKKDNALLHAAYIDLKRKSGITGTGDLAQKARDMLDESYFLVEIGSDKIPLLEYIDLIS